VDVFVAPKLERSAGCIRLTFKSAPRGTALDELYQQGCSKVRFPRKSDGAPEAVLLNTSGGLADGDTLSTDIRWRRDTRAVVTTLLFVAAVLVGVGGTRVRVGAT
jgi:urease accessory protein